ncbi:hypothetical protein B0H66DRAFT_528204 [Apodospora peruviana]|uniref:Uncharacterized protein n=1 Tax=Apodospora peruviana TaxID=516989 RepID=A0AAE0ITC8_9PEZI|nr:hypothetical protein B0H66DRAFT_528204 [Apodospora peruviana]
MSVASLGASSSKTVRREHGPSTYRGIPASIIPRAVELNYGKQGQSGVDHHYGRQNSTHPVSFSPGPPDVKAKRRNIDIVHDPAELAKDITVKLRLPIEEDFQPDLEAFCRLRRLGRFKDANDHFEAKLKHLSTVPYVLVHYAEMLLASGDYKSLRSLSHRYKYNSSRTEALSILKSNFSAHRFSRISTSYLPGNAVEFVCDTLELLSREPAMGSTEECSGECFMHNLKDYTLAIFNWNELYHHLRGENRIWDLRDLLVSAVSLFGNQEFLFRLLSVKSFTEDLDEIWKDWSQPEFEEGTTLLQVLRVALQAARFTGDYQLQAACLKLMILHQQEPGMLMDVLGTLQLDTQGDKEGFLSTCLSKYLALVAHDGDRQSRLLTDFQMSQNTLANDGPYLSYTNTYAPKPSVLWARDVITQILVEADLKFHASLQSFLARNRNLWEQQLRNYGPRLPPGPPANGTTYHPAWIDKIPPYPLQPHPLGPIPTGNPFKSFDNSFQPLETNIQPPIPTIPRPIPKSHDNPDYYRTPFVPFPPTGNSGDRHADHVPAVNKTSNKNPNLGQNDNVKRPEDAAFRRHRKASIIETNYEDGDNDTGYSGGSSIVSDGMYLERYKPRKRNPEPRFTLLMTSYIERTTDEWLRENQDKYVAPRHSTDTEILVEEVQDPGPVNVQPMPQGPQRMDDLSEMEQAYEERAQRRTQQEGRPSEGAEQSNKGKDPERQQT